MTLLIILMAVAASLVDQGDAMPACSSEPGRKAERIHGTVSRGQKFTHTTRSGWIVRLDPDATGWLLRVTMKGREAEDLSRLTPPWHFVPNPREIKGWHFRNADNTGLNDGSVNAPQELREFIFSPVVGREVHDNGSGPSADDVERVRSFGRGWFFIESYELTPPRRGERAAFESITFAACLTWPAG